MSRIEKGTDTKEQIQQMKGEVIKEIGSTKKRRPWMACSLVFFLLVVGFLSAMMWAIAATGLGVVPVFSRFAYHVPQPEYVVMPGVPIETVVGEEVKRTLIRRIQEGNGMLQDPSITFEISEASFTASLRTLLEGVENSLFESKDAQVSISSEKGFTVFLPLKDSRHQTAVQITVKAQMTDGVIEIVPESALLGSLPIPQAIVSLLLQSLIQEQIISLSRDLASFVEVNAIAHLDRKVQIDGIFSVKILEVQP